MKFTIALFALLSVSSTWAIKAKIEEPKEKRDASSDYSPALQGSHQGYQSPALSQEGASAISVGAGYSVGGARPTYSFSGQGGGATYQLQPEISQSSGRQAIQLAPITLQGGHEGLASNDLSQLMSQISHGLNTGAISLPGGQGATYQFDNQVIQGGQNAFPQFSYGGQKLSQYSLGDQGQIAIPSYSTGSKGLGTFSSTGPVLFSPESISSQQALAYGSPSSGQTYESASLPLGESGHVLQGYSLGNSAQSFGGPLKAYKGNYATSSKSSFRPSAFLGASVPSDSGHSLSAGSHAPSFAHYQSPSSSFGGLSLGSGGHGASLGSLSGYGGSSKLLLPTKSEGVGSLEAISAAFSASGQSVAPPGTTYGVPAATYTPNSVHAASVSSPQYYTSPSKYTSGSFGSGSSSYKGPASHLSSAGSYSSGPKYSYSYSSPSFGSPKDIQGSYSESSYNTIKYSEELKPRGY